MGLDIDIRLALSLRQPPCDTAPGLAGRLHERLKVVQAALNRLVKNGTVANHGATYCYYLPGGPGARPVPPPGARGPKGAGRGTVVVATAVHVNNALGGAVGSLTTRQLAEQVNVSRGSVARACQRLERRGFISRGAPQSKTLYLSPLTGEVINPSNFDRNQQLLGGLKAVVSKYEVEDKRMAIELGRVLDRQMQRGDLAKSRERIQGFRSRLLATARRAEKKTDIYALLGLLPFEREVTTWVRTGPEGK
jgi:hypothetical protein